MNTLPRLFQDPSWATIAGFSTNELAELSMLSVLSVGLVGAILYGVYIAFFRRKHNDGE